MLSSQCCENPPTLSPSSGVGSDAELGGLKCYTCGGQSDSKLAVILVSDVFGYEAPNLRKLADKVAAAGFHVVVPDIFNGEPYDPASDKPIMDWVAGHDPLKAFEDCKPLIEALRSKGISAIGAAGFCFGAKVVVEQAKCGLIEAGVLLHPTFVTADDIKEVNVPLAVLGAEIDKMSPPELVKHFEEILSTKAEVPSFVKIFGGVAHGWTMRYDVEDEKAVKAAEEAHEDMLSWFIKYVK